MIAKFKYPDMYVGYGVWRIVGNAVRKDKITYANFLYGPDGIEITTLYFNKECTDFERPEDVYMTKAEAVNVLRKRTARAYEISRKEMSEAEQDMEFVSSYCSRKCPQDEQVQLLGM